MIKNNTYIRDGRAPIPENQVTSRVMRANKDRDTKPELLLRKELWNRGLKGYRLHWKKVPGRPDISFPGKKIAIFVNGCFWHRCPYCNLDLPKSNTEFWKEKFDRNIERDKNKIKELESMDWSVVTAWECEISDNIEKVLNRIKMAWSTN